MQRDIQIEGLSKKQRVLADIIWGIGSREQFDAFVNSLPEKDRKEALVVADMILWACWDQVDTVEPETVEMINSVK